jgi:hypothetical protein
MTEVARYQSGVRMCFQIGGLQFQTPWVADVVAVQSGK